MQRTAARLTCRRWRNTSSVGDMLDELEWPSLETRREQSSLTFFFKIHSGTVSLDKDKYITPASNLRRTRASHESQYIRYLDYSYALKNSFSPGLSLCGTVFPLRWSHPRTLRSLRLRFILLVSGFQRYVFSIPITDDLDWGQHISEISAKATKTMGFLRHNLAFAPRHTKEVAYKKMVRPKLEYAAPIWHPYRES